MLARLLHIRPPNLPLTLLLNPSSRPHLPPFSPPPSPPPVVRATRPFATGGFSSETPPPEGSTTKPITRTAYDHLPPVKVTKSGGGEGDGEQGKVLKNECGPIPAEGGGDDDDDDDMEE